MKWAGGKTRLLSQLLARAPQAFDRYFEPFAGGAALFFALQPARAVLSDANADLIATYAAVRDSVESVIDTLLGHARWHGEDYYYRTREWFNERSVESSIARAAAFLYLNRVCFNGLWRVNSKGHLNVPMGAYKNPTICDAEKLRAASRALQGVGLSVADYRNCVHDARAGDFVYFDPPYDGTFNAYTPGGAFDQAALADCVRELAARGCYVMVSNADTPRVRELYAGFAIDVVHAPRAINSNGAGRGEVAELVITSTNFPRTPITETRTDMDATPTRPPDQLHFDGMAPTNEPDVEEVKEAIYLWLDARVNQRRAGEEVKQKHKEMLDALTAAGIDWHPYLDPFTQKKKRVWIAKEPKAKTSSVPKPPSEKRGRGGRKRGGPRRDDDAVIAGEETDDKVEMRRVPRKAVEKEIGASDGFASVRERMEAKQADAAKQAEKLPTRGKGKRGK